MSHHDVTIRNKEYQKVTDGYLVVLADSMAKVNGVSHHQNKPTDEDMAQLIETFVPRGSAYAIKIETAFFSKHD